MTLLVAEPAAGTSAGELVGDLSQPMAWSVPDLTKVDEYVASEMRATGVPGLAIAIVVDHATVYAKGFGVAGESGAAIAADTPFILGSLSKSFTAMAVMQLVEADRIELDAPVQRYIPWFAVSDVAASAKITVRELLNHTTGLSGQTGDSVEQFGKGSDALERNVRALAHFSLSTPPGTTYQYSNVNYQVAGYLVQVVSGQDFGEYIEEHVFAPLAMKHSFTNLAEARAAGLVLGYRTSMFGAPVPATDWPYLDGAVPSGYLISSAGDMAQYLNAHLNQGRYGPTALLSPAGIDMLHSPPDDKPETNYAMGWAARSLVGHAALVHTGATPTSMTGMTLVPDHQLGVIVLSNQWSAYSGSRLLQLSDGIATVLLGATPVTPAQDAIIQTTLAILGVMLAWQPVNIWLGFRLFRRRPRRRPIRMLAIGSLALIDASVALVCLVVLPAISDSGLRVMFMFLPDLVTIAIGLGSFALAWGGTRCVVLVAQLVDHRSTRPIRAGTVEAT
jgi:CubicO group peptidase (beta-lactamase class C family)